MCVGGWVYVCVCGSGVREGAGRIDGGSVTPSPLPPASLTTSGDSGGGGSASASCYDAVLVQDEAPRRAAWWRGSSERLVQAGEAQGGEASTVRAQSRGTHQQEEVSCRPGVRQPTRGLQPLTHARTALCPARGPSPSSTHTSTGPRAPSPALSPRPTPAMATARRHHHIMLHTCLAPAHPTTHPCHPRNGSHA